MTKRPLSNPLYIGLLMLLCVLPNVSMAQAVGGYAGGCQFNSEALALSGPGFNVIHSQRARFYGQPVLIDYLKQLGGQIQAADLPNMLVADIANVRGGPFAYGHLSHQTGLDADIWLRPAPLGATPASLETIREQDMVDHHLYILTADFTDQQRQLLALAAQHQQVSRIFVHPLIKQAMCRRYGDARWLSRLRPWFGHSGHFHVRLHCTTTHQDCQPQAAVPAGTGCGQELSSWINDQAGAISSGSRAPYQPTLPKRCQDWVH